MEAWLGVILFSVSALTTVSAKCKNQSFDAYMRKPAAKQLTPDDPLYIQPVEGDKMTETIVNFKNGNRNVVSWIPTKNSPKGIVIISHGLHEHALRYYGIAHALTAANFAVYAIDHLGHGKSDGLPGFIPDYSILCDDFVEFSEYVKALHPSSPIFLLAHSLGTLIGTLALPSIPFIKSVVFSATPIFPGWCSASLLGLKMLYPVAVSSAGQYVAGILAQIDPTGPGCPIITEGITSIKEEQERIKRDPRTNHLQIKNRTAFQALRMTREVKEKIGKVKTPFFCIHGTDDQLALYQGSEYFVGDGKNPLKRLKLYPNLRHELFYEKEPERTDAMQQVVRYFEEFL